MDHKYWIPPHEEFVSRKVSGSVENISSGWQTYQEIDEYTLDKDILSYLDDRNTEKMEFVVHPGFWEYGYVDPESNFVNDVGEETEVLDYEKYTDTLSNRLSNAVEDDQPVFTLHPSDSELETTRNYMEQCFGLSEEEYRILETGRGNGIISQKEYGKLFAILEENPYEVGVSGEVRGLCPVQFEATLASISEATDIVDTKITEGQKFPEKPVRDVGKPFLGTEWDLVEDINREQARNSFESFLIKDLPKEIGKTEEDEPLTMTPSMQYSGRYRKQ